MKSKLDVNTAFRVMDADFDGFLSKTDLKSFIIGNLGVEKRLVNSVKLDRLMRLLD